MQVLQKNGRKLLAKALMAMPAHIAWGRGDGAWNDPPATPTDRTALIDEIGRRLATDVAYVVPATELDHDVELPGKIFYKRSAEPSEFMLVRATFGFDDAVGESVREIGVFFGTVAAPGVPAGQRYLTPDQVANQGDIWSIEYRARAVRNGSTKGHEEVVIPL